MFNEKRSILCKLPVDIWVVIQGFLVPYNPLVHTVQRLCTTGNLGGIKWLLANRPKLLELQADSIQSDFAYAARHGRSDVVEYLLNIYPQRYWAVGALKVALAQHQLAIVRMLMESNAQLFSVAYRHIGRIMPIRLEYFDDQKMDHILSNVDPPTFVYLATRNIQVPLHPHLYTKAAEDNSCEMLRMLRQQGCPMDPRTPGLDRAVSLNHFEAFCLLMQYGAFPTEQVVADTMSKKREPYYQHLCELYGNRLPERLVDCAAMAGNLSILRKEWARGSTPDAETVLKACRSGHAHIVRYLLKRRVDFTHSSLNAAINGNSLPIVKVLIHHSKCGSGVGSIFKCTCTFHDECDSAVLIHYACATKGDSRVLKYLLRTLFKEESGEWSRARGLEIAMETSVLYGDLKLIDELQKYGYPRLIETALSTVSPPEITEPLCIHLFERQYIGMEEHVAVAAVNCGRADIYKAFGREGKHVAAILRCLLLTGNMEGLKDFIQTVPVQTADVRSALAAAFLVANTDVVIEFTKRIRVEPAVSVVYTLITKGKVLAAMKLYRAFPSMAATFDRAKCATLLQPHWSAIVRDGNRMVYALLEEVGVSMPFDAILRATGALGHVDIIDFVTRCKRLHEDRKRQREGN